MAWPIIAGAAAGSIGGAIIQSQAAKKIARSQLEAEQARIAKIEELGKMTPWELANFEKQQVQIEKGIARQEKLLAAADPVLLESGRQALQMLQGGESAAAAPVMQARARQRQQLESQLRNRLGSGYATSSSGIEALTRFDQETQTLNSQIMSQLMNYSAGAYGAAGAGFQGAQQFGQLAQGLGRIQERQISGITQAPLAGLNPVGLGQYELGNTFSRFGADALRMYGMGTAGQQPTDGQQPTSVGSQGSIGENTFDNTYNRPIGLGSYQR